MKPSRGWTNEYRTWPQNIPHKLLTNIQDMAQHKTHPTQLFSSYTSCFVPNSLQPQPFEPESWRSLGRSPGRRSPAPRFESSRLVVHGHSRGAHGAWGLASAAPDRVLGVAASCGWYSREEWAGFRVGWPVLYGLGWAVGLSC